MKKTLLIAGALLALTASLATAGGINLSYNDCGAFGTGTRTSTCASNSGSFALFLSAIAPAPMPQFNGITSVVDVQTNQAALSNWWGLATSGTASATCRNGSLTGTADFTTTDLNGDPVYTKCLDIWAGAAAGGINYTFGFGAPNRARMKGTYAIPGNKPADDVSEMYIMRFTINFAKTVGTCPGCLDGACIVFNNLLMTQPLGVGDYNVSNPITRQYVTWQGGAVTGGCPEATPTRTATWGSVKSLYR